MRISRDDLYVHIWSEPVTKVARRLDVSSSYLGRVCDGLNVPHPPRGYWARKAAGEKIAIPPLPPAAAGDPTEWVKGEAVLARQPAVESPPAASPLKAGRASQPSHHPLVTAWRGYLEEASPNESGYMVPRKRNLLDAFVTKGTIRGAAEALDALFIELEMRGHRVRLGDYNHHRPAVHVAQRAITDRYSGAPNQWQPGLPTLAYVRGAVIGVTLFELTEHVRVRRKGTDRCVRIRDLPAIRRYAPQSPDETDLTRDMPTGRLVLRAYSSVPDTDWRHEWTDAAAGDIVARQQRSLTCLRSPRPSSPSWPKKLSGERVRDRRVPTRNRGASRRGSRQKPDSRLSKGRHRNFAGSWKHGGMPARSARCSRNCHDEPLRSTARPARCLRCGLPRRVSWWRRRTVLRGF